MAFDHSKETILEAAKKVVTAGQLPHWLNEPNHELRGQTPRKVLDEGKFDQVVNALWQVPSNGPVS